MFVLKLIARNALRHKLRTALTIVGLLVAVTAYGLLQTVIDAWYAGARAASNEICPGPISARANEMPITQRLYS